LSVLTLYLAFFTAAELAAEFDDFAAALILENPTASACLLEESLSECKFEDADGPFIWYGD